ncbi:MAG: hypothetical protein ACKVRN_03440 [Pyrinomonadaceae bacterium]
MTIRTRLLIAILLPGLLEVVAHLIVHYIKEMLGIISRGETAIVLIFVACAVASVFFMRGAWFNRFWKIYLFSVLSATWPWFIHLVAAAIVSGTGSYYWNGVVFVSLLLITAAIVALPINYALYKSWGEKGNIAKKKV